MLHYEKDEVMTYINTAFAIAIAKAVIRGLSDTEYCRLVAAIAGILAIGLPLLRVGSMALKSAMRCPSEPVQGTPGLVRSYAFLFTLSTMGWEWVRYLTPIVCALAVWVAWFSNRVAIKSKWPTADDWFNWASMLWYAVLYCTIVSANLVPDQWIVMMAAMGMFGMRWLERNQDLNIDHRYLDI